MFKSHPFFDNSEDIPEINSFTKGLLDSGLSKGSIYAIVSYLPIAKRRAKILGWYPISLATFQTNFFVSLEMSE